MARTPETHRVGTIPDVTERYGACAMGCYLAWVCYVCGGCVFVGFGLLRVQRMSGAFGSGPN